MGARADLAAAFVTALDAADLDGVVVYAEPADTVVLPSVVIDAGDPYISPGTYGAPHFAGGLAWQFVIHVLAVRTDVGSAFDTIEAVRAALVVAGATLGATVGELSRPSGIQVNDVPAVQADLDIAWLTERET